MKWICNDKRSVRQKTSWNTVEILWQNCSIPRAATPCDIRGSHSRSSAMWRRTAGPAVPTFRQLDRTGLTDHEDGGTTSDRTVETTRLRSETRRHIAHHLVLQARSISPLLYSDRRRRATNLKNKFTVCSFCMCTRVQTCNQIITGMQLVRSVTQCPDFVKAFFTFKMACGFTARACLDLLAHEAYGLRFTSTRSIRP